MGNTETQTFGKRTFKRRLVNESFRSIAEGENLSVFILEYGLKPNREGKLIDYMKVQHIVDGTTENIWLGGQLKYILMTELNAPTGKAFDIIQTGKETIDRLNPETGKEETINANQYQVYELTEEK